MTLLCAVISLLAVSPVELTLVDDDAIGYATFQSHNQKVVANQNGIFVTHLRTRNEAYTEQTWRLSRSMDNGKTFNTIFEAVHSTNPPVLETTSNGDVYLIRADFNDGNAYLYRFLTANEYADPVITEIPRGAAGKYAMALDEARNRVYFASHNNLLHTLDLAGNVLSTVELWKGGTNAVMQYPLVDVTADGVVHLAWTTQKHEVYLYWDIHHMMSMNGGAEWRNFNGPALTPPIVVDNSGPTTLINLPDEFENHTWLSNFVVHSGKAHFMYLAQMTPPREHYVRYDIATGHQDLRMQPRFGGETLQILSLDGFFVRGNGDTIYAVGSYQGQVVCLRSSDNGTTWHDFAASDARFNVYSLGGRRTLTSDAAIIGTFTDAATSTGTTDRGSKVYLLVVPTTKLSS